MSHRSYSTVSVQYPTTDDLKGNGQFSMDYGIVEDFYNVLQGKGKFHTADIIQTQAVASLITRNSYRYRCDPVTTLEMQAKYDIAAQQFVAWSVQQGLVKSSTILADLTTMNEAFATGFGCGGVLDGGVDHSLPLLWQEGTKPTDTEAANFLQSINPDNCINDIRLYCPTVQRSLLAVQQLALKIKASLKYNKGKNTDTNERTDTTMQRSCKSLQEAKYMARSEYVHDTNTRLMRLVSGQAQVLIPQRKSRKKFARFVILDFSGSMQKRNRAQKAAAVLLDSIQSVVQHGDILHLATFGDDFQYRGQVTADNAQDLLLQVCNPKNYNTCTDYGAVLHTAYHLLKTNPDLAKLEIVLLSDGGISYFQPLLVDDCVVHLVNVDRSDTQDGLVQTIEHCRGTITRI